MSVTQPPAAGGFVDSVVDLNEVRVTAPERIGQLLSAAGGVTSSGPTGG